MDEGAAATQAVELERNLEATVDQVWGMWTEPELFKQWYGPHGATVPVAKFDLRPGGQRLVCMEMETPEGSRQMWTVGEHLEIAPNQRLAYTENPSNSEGAVVEMPGFHGETRVIVTLEASDRGTRLKLRHEGIPAGSPGQLGWEQALDKLAETVSS